MKHPALSTLTCLAAIASTGISAQTHQDDAHYQGPYIAADISFMNDFKVKAFGYEDSGDAGESYNIRVGYDVDINMGPQVLLGVEVEYRDLGEFSERYSNDSLTATGDGVSFNLRPKFYFDNAPIYVAGIVGFGRYDLKATYAEYDSSRNQYDIDSLRKRENAWQFGGELGTRINDRIDFAVSYRVVKFDIDKHVDIDARGLTVGVAYRL